MTYDTVDQDWYKELRDTSAEKDMFEALFKLRHGTSGIPYNVIVPLGPNVLEDIAAKLRNGYVLCELCNQLVPSSRQLPKRFSRMMFEHGKQACDYCIAERASWRSREQARIAKLKAEELEKQEKRRRWSENIENGIVEFPAYSRKSKWWDSANAKKKFISGCVYFADAGLCIKIGATTKSINERLLHIRPPDGCSKLTPLFALQTNDCFALEKFFHAHFQKQLQIGREYFRLAEDDLRWAKSVHVFNGAPVTLMEAA